MENQFYSKLAGVTIDNKDGRNRQTIIKTLLNENDLLTLVREPNNKADPNAIAVYFETQFGNDPWGDRRYQVGYLTSEVAAELAPLIDRKEPIICSVSEVTGGTEDKETLGVNILLEKFTPDEVNRFKISIPPKPKPPETFKMPASVVAPVKTTPRKPRSIWFYGLLAGVVIGSLASIGHLLKPGGSQDIVINFISNVIVFTLFATAGIAVFKRFIRL